MPHQSRNKQPGMRAQPSVTVLLQVHSDQIHNALQQRTQSRYKYKRLCYGRGTATRLSVEILQLQNIPIVLHYLRDPTVSRFYTTPECDRHKHTDRQTDRHTTTACTALSKASHGKNRPYCTAHQV